MASLIYVHRILLKKELYFVKLYWLIYTRDRSMIRLVVNCRVVNTFRIYLGRAMRETPEELSVHFWSDNSFGQMTKYSSRRILHFSSSPKTNNYLDNSVSVKELSAYSCPTEI